MKPTSRPAALPFLVALVLVAFAANSVLNRAALDGGHIDALSFAVLRVASGALGLGLLLALRDRRFAPALAHRVPGALALSLYMSGFSLAYVSLDSGVGALILFGGVQIVMFSGGLLAREPVAARRWVGSGVALVGLAVLLWPEGTAAPSIVHGGLMALAALGWGTYSLIGRRAADPLAATTASFLLALPLVALLLPAAALIGLPLRVTPPGLGLAVVSGVVTSGFGYALWYGVLPRLSSTGAALLQLLVPVLAALGGIAFLGETPGPRLLFASVLVLGGVALGSRGVQRT